MPKVQIRTPPGVERCFSAWFERMYAGKVSALAKSRHALVLGTMALAHELALIRQRGLKRVWQTAARRLTLVHYRHHKHASISLAMELWR